MAQESREWYQNDTGFDTDTSTNDRPSGQFKGEDIEFESFMFDSGQGVAADLFRSGPLSETSLPHSSATITMEADPVVATPSVPVPQAPEPMPQSKTPSGPLQPFMGADAPRRFESEPLRSMNGRMPSQPLTEPQSRVPSTPLSPAQADAGGAAHFSGSITPPQSGPLRPSGPLVDGRTTASGPLTSGQLSSGTPISGNLSQSGLLRSDVNTGPIEQRNTGPLSHAMTEHAPSGPLQSNGNGNGHGLGSGTSIWPGANPSQGRLSGLLSHQQLEQTGPTSTRGQNTGPLNDTSLPSRFMQTGPLTPADVPQAPGSEVSAPLHEQTSPAVPTPTSPSMSMFSQGGWSDTSLAAVEDFSSLLLAMDGARRYMTSGSLTADMLFDNATAQDLSGTNDSGAIYSNAVPVIRDTGSHLSDTALAESVAQPVEYSDGAYAMNATTDARTDVQAEQAPWSGQDTAETWNAASLMTPVETLPETEPNSQAVEQAIDQSPALGATPVEEVAAPVWVAPTWEDRVTEHSASEPETPVQLDEGTFAGQAIEFESFMFNGGRFNSPELPRIEGFMPAVTAMESAFTTPSPQEPHSGANGTVKDSADDLPFWLQNSPETSAPADGRSVQETTANQMSAQAQMEAHDYMQPDSPEFASATSSIIDYSDLPPIDPFDFTSLGLEVEEEGFGLNTEELSGFIGGHSDLMTATADLQVVASILGTDPELNTLPSKPLFQPVEEEVAPFSPMGMQATTMMEPTPATSALEVEQSAESSTSQLDTLAKEADVQPRSWTATVTSNLSPDALPMRQSSTSALPDDATVNEEAEDLDIAPFSYTDLDLDEEESPTGVLNVPKFSKTGPLNSIAAADMPYSVPNSNTQGAGRPNTQPSTSTNRIWSTSWLGDTSSQALDEKLLAAEPTLPFSTAAFDHAQTADISPWQIESDDAYTGSLEPESEFGAQSDYNPAQSYMRDDSLKTGSLQLDNDDADDVFQGEATSTFDGDMSMYDEPAFTMAEDSASAPEVSNFTGGAHIDTGSDVGTHQTWGAVAETQSPQAAPREAVSSSGPTPYTYEPLQEQEPVRSESSESSGHSKKEPSRFPTSILTSGPLPSLDGFEELQEMIVRNPDDVGAYMALAAAYSQVGDTDTQLRVFRRVLRKPSVSNKILRLIAEELTDYEATFDGHPHFHQVRGDLYMKQNRYQEAIAEYNKIV